jgi:hypothetical protein
MYRIIGADGKVYGPVGAEQLCQWLGEGRVDARTRAVAEGMTEWKPLGAFPEFSAWFSVPPIQPVPPESPGAARKLGPKMNGFAVSSLVCGVFSVTFVCCCHGAPFNLLGIVFALVALSQINRSPEVYRGKGTAAAGLILSIASVVIGILMGLILHSASTLHHLGRHLHRL